MQNLLGRAGIPDLVLKLIPPIVQTCGVCRDWAKPQPENVASIDLPDKFNEAVDADLMFVYGYIVLHMIDRCTRWYHSLIIPNKEEPTLLEALDSWVRLHGPPKVLYMKDRKSVV